MLHCSMVTATVSVKLANDMAPAISSLGLGNIMHLKIVTFDIFIDHFT
jgi:hypothetical protein